MITCDTVTIERHEHFLKQSFRSRCIINTSQGAQTLIVPLTSKHGKPIITDVKIDYSQKWLNNHWRSILTAYNNAPYFEHYSEDLHKVLFKQPVFLYDLNFELLTICLKWLKIEVSIRESLAYEKNPDLSTKDFRNRIDPKNEVFTKGPENCITYTQVFGNAFVKNISLIDLIFCTGPKALTFLREERMNK